jgi:hypothetical protein
MCGARRGPALAAEARLALTVRTGRLLSWHSRKQATTIALDPEDESGIVRALTERGDEREPFGGGR